MKSRQARSVFSEFLRGIGSSLEVAPRASYIRPTGGFKRDAKALNGDVRQVGNSMRRALASHG
ncbi:hypothetical protein HCX48_09485 [Rhodocyclus tenuis]|uniref:Uncharacterized protein n=2 Tax=Rhodocyclus TaxID=1064 RepID=A0A6L5JXM5_RHOTE|nr:hypothetical protein [Rhodocyclus gracilis]MQY52107.1 hypothetical protein [Rhodocyclus gracilis]NJA89451.1 hypothetical protein [Rhodocyclus gracilis]